MRNLMSPLIGLAVAIAMASPAAADWATKDYAAAGEYVAVSMAEDGRTKFQIECMLPDDDGYDGFRARIFADEPYDPKSSRNVPLNLVIDGRQQPTVHGWI